MRNKKFEIDLAVNTASARHALHVTRADVESIMKRIDVTMTSTMDKLINKSKSLKQIFLETVTEMANAQNYITTIDPVKGVSVGRLIGAATGLFFDSGGIVPGAFSQPIPLVAHGSEMILNPGQQANLFKMLNGQVQSGAGKANYVYAPQINTGASASEVFDVLNRHSRQFFSMVAEGVQTDSSLRNAVKGA